MSSWNIHYPSTPCAHVETWIPLLLIIIKIWRPKAMIQSTNIMLLVAAAAITRCIHKNIAFMLMDILRLNEKSICSSIIYESFSHSRFEHIFDPVIALWNCHLSGISCRWQSGRVHRPKPWQGTFYSSTCSHFPTHFFLSVFLFIFQGTCLEFIDFYYSPISVKLQAMFTMKEQRLYAQWSSSLSFPFGKDEIKSKSSHEIKLESLYFTLTGTMHMVWSKHQEVGSFTESVLFEHWMNNKLKIFLDEFVIKFKNTLASVPIGE